MSSYKWAYSNLFASPYDFTANHILKGAFLRVTEKHTGRVGVLGTIALICNDKHVLF